MKPLLIFVLLTSPARAIGITQIAAVTTVAVNVLEFKENWQKLKRGGGAVKSATRKAVKKVKSKL